MKKIDLGQTIAILANLGVIAGIVLLAFEIRQNNLLLSEQARAELAADISAFNEAFYLNTGGLATLLLKAQQGGDLTPEEEFRLDRLAVQNLLAWQAAFSAYENGLLDNDFNQGGGWTDIYYDVIPNSAEVFNRYRSSWSPGFRDYIETEIADR